MRGRTQRDKVTGYGRTDDADFVVDESYGGREKESER